MPGPYNFLVQPSWLRNLVLSPNSQLAWGTPLADGKLTLRQRFDAGAVLEQTITRRSDKDYAGKGTSFATNGQITTYDTKFSGLKAELSDNLAGYALAFLSGKDVVTGGLATPAAPGLSSTAGGALAATTYYAKVTYVGASGESLPSAESSLAVVVDDVLNIASPAASTGATGYNVYVGTAAGAETKQNAAAINIGTAWVEPTTGLIAGAAVPTTSSAPFTHTFTFDESTRIAVPTTLYCEDTESLHYKCPDMCMDSVMLTISEIGAIMAEMAMVGTGYQIMGSMTSVPAVDTDTYLLGSDAALTFGPVGSPASFIGRHMKTVLKLENQLTAHKAPGGGLYGLFVRKGNPKFSIQTTIAAKDTDDVYTLFTNDTASAFTLTVDSGTAAQMTISIPATHLKTTKIGQDKDMIVWNVEADETTCYQAAGVPPITLTVVNRTPSYLVGA